MRSSLRARSIAVALGLALAPAAASCSSDGGGGGRPDDQLGGLVHAPEEPAVVIDVGKASSDPAELVRAASQPHEKVASTLGAHAVTGGSHIDVRENGKPVEALDDEIAIQLDAKGNYHALDNNSREYGREVYFVGGQMYLRPRYGKFHQRPPADEAEAVRMRDEIFGTVAADLDLLAPGLAVADGGAGQVAGRAARIVKLSTAEKTRPPAPQANAQRKWRESVVVKQVTGEIALDAKSGLPLRASLRGEVAFTRDGRHFDMRLEAHHEIVKIGGVAAIAAPEPDQTIADIGQRHELVDRDTLLDGLAPRSRGAAPPKAEGPATGK